MVSEATLAELVQVARRPNFGMSSDHIAAILDSYLTWSETVVVAEPPKVPECRDPQDLPFLQLALIARADALVNGDGDLLSLAPEFAIPIISPATLRQILESNA